MFTSSLSLSLSLSLFLLVDNNCYSSQSVSLNDQATISYSNGTQYHIGYPLYCTPNYTYAAICSNRLGLFEAMEICSGVNYPGGGYNYSLFGNETTDYFPALTTNGVYNYICPMNASNLGVCKSLYQTGNGCENYDGAGIVTCRQGKGLRKKIII